MTDKKLTDKEIIKALECCINEKTCKNCAYNGRPCLTPLKRDALDLINRLQAEKQNLEVELQAMRGAANSYKVENERLEELIDVRHKVFETKCEELEIAKAEAYKEFAELLHCQCESIINQPHNENVRPISWKAAYEEFDEKIDNLLKEMVGDSNAKEKE